MASGASIASGIKSPTVARKVYNTPTFGGGMSKGVAGGVKGRTTPQKEVFYTFLHTDLYSNAEAAFTNETAVS